MTGPATADARTVSQGARLDALRDVGLLDAANDPVLMRLTRMAGDLLGVPISLVSLVGADRQFFAGSHGLAPHWAQERETPLTHSFCRYVVEREQPLVVADSRESPELANNLAVRDLDVIAYAGVPLTLRDGHTLGAFCAIDSIPRAWHERDLRTLSDLAAVAVDVLEARRSASAQNLHDRLTGLPGRALFGELVARALASSQRSGATTAVVAVELDDFRLINDAFGHAVGDLALMAVGARLVAAVRTADAVCRLAGDEFLVLCAAVADAPDAAQLAERIHHELTHAPLRLSEHDVRIRATTGVAAAAPGSADADDLIEAARDTLERNKRGVPLPKSPRSRRATRRLLVQNAMAGAELREELSLAYQPLVNLRTGRLDGLEALLRWRHPRFGNVTPDEFIPTAERTGTIIPIGEWIIGQAIDDLRAWREQAGGLTVAINVAPVQLRTPSLAPILEEQLRRGGLSAEAITLEITERVLLDDRPAYASAMGELRGLGARIALDDFGTGYSALSYLTHFPLDVLKLDRSFVGTLGADPRAEALLEGIANTAGRLGMTTVAEGIETAEQLAAVTRLGCDLGQGYFLARPLPAAEIEPLLTKRWF